MPGTLMHEALRDGRVILGFHAQQAVEKWFQVCARRQHEALLDAEPLDRRAAVAIVTEAERWARGLLDEVHA